MRTKKAISEVLAMLLMVVIVVGLIGTVYFFISGIVGRQTAGIIQIGGTPQCVPGTRIEILATNVGTTAIPENQIRVFVGGNAATRTITAEDKSTSLANQNINPGQSFWILVTNPQPVAGQTYRGQIVYAGKAVDFVVTC